MSEHYAAIKRTGLCFKGEDNKRKKQRRLVGKPGEAKEEESEQKQDDSDVPVIEGAGRICSTTTTVHGFETKFREELSAGDTIFLHHPVSLEVEKRVVTGVLSQRSCVLHQAFSKDVVSTLEYHIRKDSLKLLEKAKEQILDGEDPEALKDATSAELEKQLEKQLKKQRKQCAVREKTGMWGYKVVTKSMSKEVTQEELLDERCKQGRDKRCW
mmetsp:Transcript_14611/g.40159  ORF Transcript_14611/g.40159 Transcript_14611/m.40159 type:complete len:213 (-) Transcript_14611:11-649(-)